MGDNFTKFVRASVSRNMSVYLDILCLGDLHWDEFFIYALFEGKSHRVLALLALEHGILVTLPSHMFFPSTPTHPATHQTP